MILNSFFSFFVLIPYLERMRVDHPLVELEAQLKTLEDACRNVSGIVNPRVVTSLKLEAA